MRKLQSFLLAMLLCVWIPVTARGETAETYPEPEMNTEELRLEAIQDYLDSVEQFDDHAGKMPSFQNMMKALMAGNLASVLKQGAEICGHLLLSEIRTNRGLMGQILILALIGAAFSDFSGIFGSGNVSEVGFYVVYLMIMAFLAASFFASVSIAAEAAGKITEFMRVLLPSYLLAVAAAGGAMTSAAVCSFTFGAIGAVQAVLAEILLPMTRIYMLLVLAGNLLKEDMISKCTELLEHVILWALKTMFGIIVGFHIIQGMILPHADAVKNVSLLRLAQAIPGIGGLAGSVAQMIFGSGVLIKNTLGAAGILVLLFLAAVPLMKLLILMCLYHLLGAVMQPVCDKRLVACMTGIAVGHGILLKIVTYSIALFAVTIAILCITTNGILS